MRCFEDSSVIINRALFCFVVARRTPLLLIENPAASSSVPIRINNFSVRTFAQRYFPSSLPIVTTTHIPKRKILSSSAWRACFPSIYHSFWSLLCHSVSPTAAVTGLSPLVTVAVTLFAFTVSPHYNEPLQSTNLFARKLPLLDNQHHHVFSCQGTNSKR